MPPLHSPTLENPAIFLGRKDTPSKQDSRKSFLRSLFLIFGILAFLGFLLYLILNIVSLDSFIHFKYENDKDAPSKSSFQGISFLDEQEPIFERHNLKFKSTWKGWDRTVILISLDGFRFDYLFRKDLIPTLYSLSEEGISSKMHPIFPSITFPNHFSMATGLYPDAHGIINNAFYDPTLKDCFSYRNPATVDDAKWWNGNPVWF